MKGHKYGWTGDYFASLFVPPLHSLSQRVPVQNSRSQYFTIFCRLQSCGWILCPGAMRELKLIQEFLSYTWRGRNREGWLCYTEMNGIGPDQSKGVGHGDTRAFWENILLF